MAKQKFVIRAVRFDEALDKKIERAIKAGGFSSRSTFFRSAIERELAGQNNGLDEAEVRIAASLDRVARDPGVRLGQQALFAFVDALVKTLLPAWRSRRRMYTIRRSPAESFVTTDS